MDSKIWTTKHCSQVPNSVVALLVSLCYMLGEQKITAQLFKTIVNLVNISYFWHLCQCSIVILYLGTVNSKQEGENCIPKPPRVSRPVPVPPVWLAPCFYQTKVLLWIKVCRIRTSGCDRKSHFQRWGCERGLELLTACCKVSSLLLNPEDYYLQSQLLWFYFKTKTCSGKPDALNLSSLAHF